MKILSVDGGGYLGLASVAYLDAVERHFGVRCADQFDLYCGTSTGAIIALALANGLSAAQIVALYEDLGAEVFRYRRSRRWKYTMGLFRPQYEDAPLRAALGRAFGETTLGDLQARGKCVLVTAYCITTGEPRIFKTDHSPNLSLHRGYRLADIARASAAAPTYFPLVELAHPVTQVRERFCDGGVFANTPALLGFAEALREFKSPPGDVAVLSVSTPRSDLAERPGAKPKNGKLRGGLLGWGPRLADIATNATAAVSHGALERIVEATGGQLVRVALKNSDALPFDLVTPGVTASLKGIGATEGAQTSNRTAVRPFFT